ncbi:unnamed protein product [Parnassius apollo]|uniref:(apollo) hypothetical protein n=1 Tax=Parnassius apollo TaxID=110799 RepID=A0A8S3WI60_PARAO|nr:unnamed protein product [Parnassius apollo]
MLPCYIDDNETIVRVRWYKNDELLGDTLDQHHLLPPRIRMHVNYSLQIDALSAHDTADYTCEVVRPEPWGPIKQTHSIEVQYAPVVKVDRSFVHTAIGLRAALEATLEFAAPPANTAWFKDGSPVKTDDRVIIMVQENSHQLIFRSVRKSDFGNYTFRAENKLGMADVSFKLTGQKGKKLDVWRIGLGCIAFLQSWSHLYPSLSKTWQTELGTSCAPTYLVTPNSSDYDVRLFLHRMEMATAGNAAPLDAQQTAYVDAAVNIPFVANSDDDGIVSHELEKMRSILEESMLETRSMPLENRPRLPRIPLSKRNRAVVRALNPMLVTYLEASRDLCETDSILFGAALAVCRIIGAKLPVAGRATQKSSAIPAWRKRIEDRIAKARALIGRLTSFRSGNNRPRIMRTVRMAFAGTNINLFQPDITQKLTERIDDLKQKIAAWGKRIRRFSERSRRFNQNRLFQSDQKRLYKTLERPKVCGAGPGPDQADTVAFWRGLWSEPVNHSEGPWTEVVASQSASVTPMDPVTITPEDVAEASSLSIRHAKPADRVRYILRSNIFGDAELERLRREAIPSSNGNATAGNAAPLDAQQTAYVDAAVNIPFVANSDDDGIVSHELEKMRSILEESMLETRSMPLENRPRLPRIPLSKRNRAVVRALNPMLVTYLEASRDLCETDSILFGAALAVCRIIGAKLPVAGRATQKSSAIPAWRKRIEDRIAKARALIGRLTSFRSGNNRPRIMRTVRMAFAGTNISLFQPDITQKLTERTDDLKQKIAAWGKRIRRFSERSRRFNQNRLFQSDQKRLYKSLERPKVCGAGPGPDQADTVAFWRGLWSEPVNHSEGPWMEVVASQSASVTPMDPVTITPEDVAEAVRRAPNWKKLEPSLSVTEQNLADRVRYILRSNIFGDAELERLRREAIPSSNGNATAGNAAPLDAQQTANVDAAVNIPFVANSDDDGIVSHELEKMRSILEESMLETRSMPLENRPRLPRIPLSKRNRAVVRALNPMLVTYLEASRDLCETDSILFGAALAVCRIIGAKFPVAGRATQKSSAIPAWRKRIEDRIAKARALIGRLTSFRSGNNRPRIMRTVRMAFAGTNISLSQPDITQKLTERIDDLKQKIAAWGKRIRRFSERSRRFNQNRLFQSDQKRLYKTLERPEVCGAGPGPDQADTVAFWRGLWSEPVNNSKGPWTEVVASQSASVTPMDPVTITPEDVAEAVRRAPNWKSPGLDGLHHYWLKGELTTPSPADVTVK